MKRTTVFYLFFVGGFTLLALVLLRLGSGIHTFTGERPSADAGVLTVIWEQMSHHLTAPLALLLIQILVVLIVARFLGALCLKIGQPTVVGEIVAGIALGPSLLGMFLPGVTAALFPEPSLGKLSLLAQMGLVLFMFVIGIELDLGLIKNKAGEAVIISHASIVFPFFLGIALSLALYGPFAPKTTSFVSFALFMGIAMSITAFPVLARIIQERNMTRTTVGTIAITCAAADDVTAWCLLAVVIAIVQAGTITGALATLLLTVIYLVIMLKVVAPFLERLSKLHSSEETIGKPVMALIFVVLLVSSWSTEVIGIHALFGAFLAGAMMPSDHNFRRILTERVEDVAMVLLLPLFFVFTGLRTQLGLLDSPKLWLVCIVVIAVAVAGKLLGSAFAARYMGMSWNESLVIGVLMNTRGLMELVVLNIGYDLGVLSAEVFTMMVMMALGTTVMTGPALNFLEKFAPKSEEAQERENSDILISFGPPKKGSLLLGLAKGLMRPGNPVRLTALHLTPNADVNPLQAKEFERTAFETVNQTAEKMGLEVETMYRATPGVEETIVEEANKGVYEIVLVGASLSLFSSNELGGVTSTLLKEVRPHLGVLVDRGFQKAGHVFYPLLNQLDLELIPLLQRLVGSGTEKISVLDPHGLWEPSEAVMSERVVQVTSEELTDEFWSSLDLTVVSSHRWDALKATQSGWMERLPSVLIFRPGTHPLHSS